MKEALPRLRLLRSQPGWQMLDLVDPSFVITHADISEAEIYRQFGCLYHALVSEYDVSIYSYGLALLDLKTCIVTLL